MMCLGFKTRDFSMIEKNHGAMTAALVSNLPRYGRLEFMCVVR